MPGLVRGHGPCAECAVRVCWGVAMVEVAASGALAAAGVVGGAATSSDAVLAGALDSAQQGLRALLTGNQGSGAVSGVDVEGTGDVADSLFPRAYQLPVRPPRAIECNYTHWAAVGKCLTS